jgi:alkanesulfonate monooxygenase SsuD/methylene tetrahydromethanopterin reductase-like flavin-dependent oxidoreductase (luciferase family)
MRLGTLVTPVTFRWPGVTAKAAATLSVLAGGRAFVGVGAGWWEREHAAFDLPFPPAAQRLDELDRGIRVMRALWAPGTRPYSDAALQLPETTCYPRPAAPIPVVVGGAGERRTLRIAAELGDACNLVTSDPAVLRHKVGVLHAHCDDAGRDRAAVQITHLSEAAILGTDDTTELDEAVATVNDQIGRYRELAEAGVHHAIVALHLDGTPSQVDAFAPVIAAFRT